MTTPWLLAAAFADVQAARQWYEAQRLGLGDEFVDTVDDALSVVSAHPRAFQVEYRDLRRCLLERFRTVSTTGWRRMASWWSRVYMLPLTRRTGGDA